MLIVFLLITIVASSELKETLVNATDAFAQETSKHTPYPHNSTVVIQALEQRCGILAHLGRSCMNCHLDTCMSEALLGTPALEAHNQWIKEAIATEEKRKAASYILRAFLETVYDEWNTQHPELKILRSTSHWNICWK